MSSRKLAAFGTAVVALTIGVAPILTNAADHLDAPALGGATANGQIAPHSEHGDRDINDVYVFRAPDNANRTVIAMTVNPAINLFGGNFGTSVRYILNVDKNGDNKADLAYVARFGRVDRDSDAKNPEQDYRIVKYTGSNARSFERGTTVAPWPSRCSTPTSPKRSSPTSPTSTSCSWRCRCSGRASTPRLSPTS